jgi:hypothetical protein
MRAGKKKPHRKVDVLEYLLLALEFSLVNQSRFNTKVNSALFSPSIRGKWLNYFLVKFMVALMSEGKLLLFAYVLVSYKKCYCT